MWQKTRYAMLGLGTAMLLISPAMSEAAEVGSIPTREFRIDAVLFFSEVLSDDTLLPTGGEITDGANRLTGLERFTRSGFTLDPLLDTHRGIQGPLNDGVDASVVGLGSPTPATNSGPGGAVPVGGNVGPSPVAISPVDPSPSPVSAVDDQ